MRSPPGTTHPLLPLDWPKQHPAATCGGFLSVVALLALVLPSLPALIVLAFGFGVILGVQHWWVRVEKRRTLLVKKLADGDATKLPELRWASLVAGGFIALLVPLAFMKAQQSWALFATAGSTTYFHWLWFAVDQTFLQGLPDWKVLYGIHLSSISPDSPWARHLIMASRLLFNFFLIRAILRLWAIRATIKETVLAIVRDPGMAVRLGSRAVAPLCRALEDSCMRAVVNAAKALGKIGDPQARAPLYRLMAASDWELRRQQGGPSRFKEVPRIKGSEKIRSGGGLVADDEPGHADARLEAAIALGLLGDDRAVPILLAALKRFGLTKKQSSQLPGFSAAEDETPMDQAIEGTEWRLKKYKARVILALANLKRPEATPLLKRMLRSKNMRLVKKATALLGGQEKAVAVPALLHAVASKLGYEQEWAAEALVQFGSGAVPEILVELLRAIRQARWSSACPLIDTLGEIGDRTAVEPLLAILRGDVQPDSDDATIHRLQSAPFGEQYSMIARLCVALAKLGDTRALGLLRSVLADARAWDRDVWLAKIEEAVRALEARTGATAG